MSHKLTFKIRLRYKLIRVYGLIVGEHESLLTQHFHFLKLLILRCAFDISFLILMPYKFLQVTLCIFCIINSFFTLLRAFSFAFGGLQAAVQVHDTLLNKLIHAPIQFFHQTPGGRILNRLVEDNEKHRTPSFSPCLA